MAERVGFVYVQNRYAGKIEETDEGYRFSYDKQYMMDPCSLPVSLTMPLAKECYESNVLFPFFDGLIPEGWMLQVVDYCFLHVKIAWGMCKYLMKGEDDGTNKMFILRKSDI